MDYNVLIGGDIITDAALFDLTAVITVEAYQGINSVTSKFSRDLECSRTNNLDNRPFSLQSEDLFMLTDDAPSVHTGGAKVCDLQESLIDNCRVLGRVGTHRWPFHDIQRLIC